MHNIEFLKEHAVYQIYPISFCDRNDDGKGDLKGIISKLDYLKDIGIKIIWLSPIYESPMMDFGYDISDYKKINPIFGTMDDFDVLMKEATDRGIKIIMDLVVNHTSDQHTWFKEALKDKNSPYRDYYIFKEGKKDKKGNYTYPNNWTSNFTGSAWEKVEGEEGMYYLHIFTKQQPDLNWHNPKVLEEVESIIKFWMEKGVYGFRCDVISQIYKDSYEDGNTKTDGFSPIGQEHYLATQGNHDILKRIREDVIKPYGGVLIGECGGNITVDDGKKYLDNELDTFFEFDKVDCYKNYFSSKINPNKFKKAIIHWQEHVSWNGNYLENHDQHRVFDRYVYGENELYGAKMLLTLQYTLRGTPFIYMGQEFATHNYPNSLPLNECSDIVTHNVFKLARSYHLPKFLSLKLARKFGRDDERAPLAFNDDEFCGFSNTTPWQRINPLSKKYNVKTQAEEKDSVLNFFKKINKLREENEILNYGDINFINKDEKNILCYIRELNDKKIAVILNLVGKKEKMPEAFKQNKKILISNYSDISSYLRPYEALVFLL